MSEDDSDRSHVARKFVKFLIGGPFWLIMTSGTRLNLSSLR